MPSFSDTLEQELQRLLAPLANATGSADRWALILALVGQNGTNDAGLRTALDQLGAAAKALSNGNPGWDGIEDLLGQSASAVNALEAVGNAATDPAVKARLAQLGPDLAEQLTAIYLRRYHPRAYRTAATLTLVDPGVANDATDSRAAWTSDELHLERLGQLTRDPWGTLRAAYLPNDLKTAADAHAAAERLFPLLADLLAKLGLPGTNDILDLTPAVTNDPENSGNHFNAPEPEAPADDTSPVVDLAPY